MRRQELEVYSEATDYAVVRMPDRRFPGCVVQGDTLFNLTCVAKTVLERVRQLGDEELAATATDLAESLEMRLNRYELVLKEHGIPLPFVR